MNKKITVLRKDLHMLPSGSGYVRRINTTSTALLNDIYEKFAVNYGGMLKRTEKWWKRYVIGNQTATVYFTQSGEAKGYMLYTMKNKLLDVDEIISLDPEAVRGLCNFICQHDPMSEKVEIMISVNDCFPFFLDNPHLQIELKPYFMARIVVVESFVSEYPFIETPMRTFLHLTDEYAPWNNGIYLFHNGKITAFKKKRLGPLVFMNRYGEFIFLFRANLPADGRTIR
ncbi:GNAT family N-acetyltransferase [Bacillus sp. M6-12]|uniref:GNAT family N-acetyltransferase n=1 Tax=Bacillus sp. M6-12 TaxID=2054166 RepID=UPI0015E0B190|nr:hypothetical protein [Bacillus sp. M6-12]